MPTNFPTPTFQTTVLDAPSPNNFGGDALQINFNTGPQARITDANYPGSPVVSRSFPGGNVLAIRNESSIGDTAINFLCMDPFYRGNVYATASIAGNVLTVTALNSGGGTIGLGWYITATGLTDGLYITSFGTGTGGAGTYNLSGTATLASTNVTIAPAFEHMALGFGGFNQPVDFVEFSCFDGSGSVLQLATELNLFQTGAADNGGARYCIAQITSGSTAITTTPQALFTGSITSGVLTISAPNVAVAAANVSGNGTTCTLTFNTALPVAVPVGTSITIAGFTFTPSGANGTFTVTASTVSSVSFASAATASSTAGTVAITSQALQPGIVIAGTGVSTDSFITAAAFYGSSTATNGAVNNSVWNLSQNQTVASTSMIGGVLPVNGSLAIPGTAVSNYYVNRSTPQASGIQSAATLASGQGTFTGTLSSIATLTNSTINLFFAGNPTYGQRPVFQASAQGPIFLRNSDGSVMFSVDRYNKRVAIGATNTPRATLDVNGTMVVEQAAAFLGILTRPQAAGYSGGSGTTYNPPAGVENVILNDSGTPYASLTVTTPPNPVPGQYFGISTVGGITALTMTATSGSVFRGTGNPTTLPAGGTFKWQYNINTVWYPIAV